MMFIDTHAHLYLDAFLPDRDQIIKNALDVNVEKIILPNIDLNSLPLLLSLSNKYPSVCYPAIGLHPCDVKENFLEVLNQMELYTMDDRFVAIGETGTDAYWDITYWEEQKLAFRTQLQWAIDYSKPVIIHSRESLEENIRIVREMQNGKLSGIFHCFGGTESQAKEIIDLGFYLGIGGTVSYKNNPLIQVLKSIGLSSVVLETDSPFLSPVPYRGKRNESSYIPIIGNFLAESLELDLKEIAKITTENAYKIFKLKGNM